jgi:Carboxypeptidase regulatory-like domain
MTTVTRTLSALCLACAAVWAQAPTAQITGTVKDSNGAAVPGAEVKATQTATGAAYTATSGADGGYKLSGLPNGPYTLEIGKQGFRKYAQTGIVLQGNASPTMDASLQQAEVPSGNATAPSLADLGFSPAQAQGSAQDQARLDRRSNMLRTHQRLGLITLAPLVATFITSSGAAGRHSSASGRDLHGALGAATAGMYFTTASFAIFAPKVPGTRARGPIRLHKALAWIHGPGMVLTPILGAMAFSQLNNGEKVHGIAKAHSTVAWVTGVAYGAAILSVSIKF